MAKSNIYGSVCKLRVVQMQASAGNGRPAFLNGWLWPEISIYSVFIWFYLRTGSFPPSLSGMHIFFFGGVTSGKYHNKL